MAASKTVFFHRTAAVNARQILTEGFRDGRDRYMTDHEFEGVWLSDRPINCNEGAWGDTLLMVTLPGLMCDFDDYEWVEDGKPHREWLVPAALLNELGTIRPIDDGELNEGRI